MRKICIAVTGARQVDRQGRDRIEETFAHLAENLDVRMVVTGAQYGADTTAFDAAITYLPRAGHVVIYPEGLPHNEDLVTFARDQGHTVIACPDGYLARNDWMLDEICTPALDRLLVAFPSTATERRRSGTWATKRRASRRDIPVLLMPLDGSPSHLLGAEDDLQVLREVPA